MRISSTAISGDHIPANLQPVINALCDTARELAVIIAKGPLGQSLGHEVGENSDGDGQKALDVLADDMFLARLCNANIRWYASEEQEDVISLDREGRYALAIDPLDGSSNIDVNVSIGTIFSIFEAHGKANESFLRPASEQIAAGYIIYGPQTGLAITFGAGTQFYLLNPDSNHFELVDPSIRVSDSSTEYAINASNYRHWDKPIRAYIDDCIAGSEGPRSEEFNMRWVASLVAETHRILSRGGVFLYPSDSRSGYASGRLRMVYECAPIAFLIEQAGGKATDGTMPIMQQSASSLHARTSFVFGSPDNVSRIGDYFSLSEQEVSALFNSRGLFRA